MIEYRESTGGVTGDGKSLVGLVTPFDVWTTIGEREQGGWDERIAPGAFTKTLREQDPVLINAHNTGQPMARTSVADGGAWSGHLTLTPDPSAGLRAMAYPIDATYCRDVLAGAKAGVIPGMSFGFQVIKDEWTDDEGRAANKYNGTKRTIQEVRLFEVTTSAFPAYPTTELSARDQTGALLEMRAKRAAKATYSDLNTCADCGAAEQYSAFCTACGKPMDDAESATAFCGSCGADLDGDRAGHVCGEKRQTAGDILLDAVAQVISLVNKLPADQRALAWKARRDAVDGDGPNAEFYKLLKYGGNLAPYESIIDQLSPSVQDALRAILDELAAQVEEVSATDGHGAVSEDGAGSGHSDEDERADDALLAEIIRVTINKEF